MPDFRVRALDAKFKSLVVQANTPKEALQEFFRQFGENVPITALVTTNDRVCKSTHRIVLLSNGSDKFGYDTRFTSIMRPNCP